MGPGWFHARDSPEPAARWAHSLGACLAMACLIASALRELLEIRSLPATVLRTVLSWQAALPRRQRSCAHRRTRPRRQTPPAVLLRQGQLPTRSSSSTVPSAEPAERAHLVPPVVPALPVVVVLPARVVVSPLPVLVFLPVRVAALDLLVVLALPELVLQVTVVAPSQPVLPVLWAAPAKFRPRTRPVPVAAEGESLPRAAAFA